MVDPIDPNSSTDIDRFPSGDYDITITAASSFGSSDSFSFILQIQDDPCDVTQVGLLEAIPDMIYQVGTGPVETTEFIIDYDTENCPEVYIEFREQVEMSMLTRRYPNSFVVESNSDDDVGAHTVPVMVAITQLETRAVHVLDFAFLLTVTPCAVTAITSEGEQFYSYTHGESDSGTYTTDPYSFTLVPACNRELRCVEVSGLTEDGTITHNVDAHTFTVTD